MSRARVILGKTGEDLACAELERRGYAIIARRYRRRGGEIDIVSRDGETIVFRTDPGLKLDKVPLRKVAFEIDTPARWAWHDHSASSRRAHGAAYATYVGS